jgi:hypothetical protein
LEFFHNSNRSCSQKLPAKKPAGRHKKSSRKELAANSRIKQKLLVLDAADRKTGGTTTGNSPVNLRRNIPGAILPLST